MTIDEREAIRILRSAARTARQRLELIERRWPALRGDYEHKRAKLALDNAPGRTDRFDPSAGEVF